MNIFLIGYRCTGKSSVGRLLSEILERPFFDADEVLAEEQGASIADIVRTKGWDAFRKMERDVIRRLCARERCVVATGGGAVLDAENVRNMRKSGIVVWLRAGAETVKARMLADGRTEESRPALTAKGLSEEIEDVLRERRVFYRNAMDFYLDTDAIDVEEASKLILKKLNSSIILPAHVGRQRP